MHVLFNKFASLVGYYQVFFVLFPGQGGFCWVLCAASFVGLFVAVYIMDGYSSSLFIYF